MEIELLQPVAIDRIADSHWFVDFGRAVFGTGNKIRTQGIPARNECRPQEPDSPSVINLKHFLLCKKHN